MQQITDEEAQRRLKDQQRTENNTIISQEQSVKEYQALLRQVATQHRKPSSKNLLQAYQQFPIRRWFYLEQDQNVYYPRTGHAAVAANDSIYVFGGIDIDGNRNNDLHCLDLNEQSWKKLPAEGAIPAQRSGARAVYFGASSVPGSPTLKQEGEIVIFGGYITKDISHCNDLVSYNLATNTWTLIQSQQNDDIPAKRTDHSMVRYNKFLYVFGGRGENKQIFRDLKRFNYSKKIWKDIKGEGAQIVPRFGHIAVTHDHSMWVFGGWDGVNCLDDMFQYSYVTNIWYEIRRCFGDKPSPRYRHDALMFQDNMYVFGGVDQQQTRFNDLYRFNFQKREWTKVITSGCLPSPRTFHKIIGKGENIFLLGGYDGERRNDLHMIKLESQKEYEIPKSNQDLSLSLLSEENIVTGDQSSDIDHIIKVLNEQVKELSKKIQREEDKNLCKICFSREIDTVLMECCHFILCFSCTTNLKNCPICRSVITRVIKTHLY